MHEEDQIKSQASLPLPLSKREAKEGEPEIKIEWGNFLINSKNLIWRYQAVVYVFVSFMMRR